MTITELQAARETLLLRLNGVKRSSFADKSVDFSDASDIEKQLAILDGLIVRAGGAVRTRVLLVQHSNG